MSVHYLLLFAVGVVVWLTGLAALFQWTYRDTRARGSDQPGMWAIGVVVLLPLVLPYYLIRRSRDPQLAFRSTPPTEFDRLLATWATASLLAFFPGTLLTPPDPIGQVWGNLLALAVTTPLAYLLVYRDGIGLLKEMVGR